MATYTKKLKTIEIHSLLNDMVSQMPIEDTATDAAASRALADFLAYRDITFQAEMSGQVSTIVIPYHAVQYIVVTSTEATITKDDPYCNDSGN